MKTRKMKYLLLTFILFNILCFSGFAQETAVYNNINEIKVSTSADSMMFVKRDNQWTSHTVKHIDLDLLNLLVKRLSRHSLTPIQGDYSNDALGTISFYNGSTYRSYQIIKQGQKSIIGYDQSYFLFTIDGFMGDPLIGFMNTNQWSWTDLSLSAGMEGIKYIKFKSEVYKNYHSNDQSLIELFGSLKRHAHVKSNNIQKGRQIGVMKVKYSGGKKKMIFFEKRIAEDKSDTNRCYICIDNAYFECDYYYFNSLFEFGKIIANKT